MYQRGNNIKVYVRIRPLNQLEAQLEGTSRCIEQTDDRSIRVTNFEGTGSTPFLNFAFDKVFSEQSEQQSVFGGVAEEIVKSAFEGINGTIFCYGQTASGKTFTCVGPELNGQKRGLLPRIIENVMQRVRIRPSNIDLRAKVSLVEIYNEKVTDLLDLTRRNLKLRQNKNKGVFIEHVTERYISKSQEGYQLLGLGLQNRSVGCTQMNAVSSRSHMLFMITLVSNDFATGQAKSAKLTVVDLAGSQKISKTGTQGKQLSEAIKINTSLSALGNVIHSLSQSRSGHIPYRDSKLTRLLQESLGGNSLTSLIVNVSPSTFNQTETVTSLRFGQRAKAVKNSPKINRQYTVQQLLSLLEKAEMKIKSQNKIIEQLNKKKRVGGYGIIQDKPLTLHILKDQEQDQNDSNYESNSQIDESSKSKKKIAFRRNSIDRPISKKIISQVEKVKQKQPQIEQNFANLKILATSLKCIPTQSGKRVVIKEDKQSLTSQQNLLQDVQQRVLARTRSQAALMANRHDEIIQQNARLSVALEHARGEVRDVKQTLQKAIQSIQLFRQESKAKDEVIAKKNLMIEKLKQKNQQRKHEIQIQINNLKKFWEKYYETDEQDRPKPEKQIVSPELRYSDSATTLRITKTAKRPKIIRNQTEFIDN